MNSYNEILERLIPNKLLWNPIDAALYKLKNPYDITLDYQNKKTRFEAIKFSFSYHYSMNKYYRNLCKEFNIKPNLINREEDLTKIPLISGDLFKIYKNKLWKDNLLKYLDYFLSKRIDNLKVERKIKKDKDKLIWFLNNNFNLDILYTEDLKLICKDFNTTNRMMYNLYTLLNFSGGNKCIITDMNKKYQYYFYNYLLNLMSNNNYIDYINFNNLSYSYLDRIIKYKKESKLDKIINILKSIKLSKLIESELMEGNKNVTLFINSNTIQDLYDTICKYLENIDIVLYDNNFPLKNIINKNINIKVPFIIPELNGFFHLCKNNHYHIPYYFKPLIITEKNEIIDEESYGRLAILDPISETYPSFIKTDYNCFLDSRCECGLKSLYLRDINKIK